MDARPPTVSRSGVDTAIRIGVVVLTLMAAIVHLSLLLPDPVRERRASCSPERLVAFEP
jgi:hypothetical protein